jgi:hypothetical protein
VKTEKPNGEQRSYLYATPTHLLASLLRCKSCNGGVVQVSSKRGGYYGCTNVKQKACTNKFSVPKKRVEALIINDLKEKFLTAGSVNKVANSSLSKGGSYYVAYTNIQALALLSEGE